jgi:hypothetical protein
VFIIAVSRVSRTVVKIRPRADGGNSNFALPRKQAASHSARLSIQRFSLETDATEAAKRHA